MRHVGPVRQGAVNHVRRGTEQHSAGRSVRHSTPARRVTGSIHEVFFLRECLPGEASPGPPARGSARPPWTPSIAWGGGRVKGTFPAGRV